MKQTSDQEAGREPDKTGGRNIFHFIRKHWILLIVAVIIIVIIAAMIIAPISAKRKADKQARDLSQRPQPVT